MRPSLAQINWITATKYRLHPELLKDGKRRSARRVARPRQVAMYLARMFTTRSSVEIGRFFNRDHTTCLHAIKRIASLMKVDPVLASHIEELAAALPPMVQKRQRTMQDDVERLWAGEVSWRVGPDKLPPARF